MKKEESSEQYNSARNPFRGNEMSTDEFLDAARSYLQPNTCLTVLIDMSTSRNDVLSISLCLDGKGIWSGVPTAAVESVLPLHTSIISDTIVVARIKFRAGFELLQGIYRSLYTSPASENVVEEIKCGRGLEIDLTWQWNNDPGYMLQNLSDIASSETQAFENVAGGQDHNPPVHNAYVRCHRQDPNGFWESVATAAYKAYWDRDGIVRNLDWQWHNNRDSMKRAQDRNTGSGPFPRALGMYHMMDGQRHNPGIMAAYRAAFRDDPNWWWETVNSYR